MPRDTVVDSPSIEVMYVAGDRREPIPIQAPKVMSQLEASLPSIRGRKFYGVVHDGEYRACVAIRPEIDTTDETTDDTTGDTTSLPHPRFTVPGGRYVHRRLPDWDNKTEIIGRVVDELAARPDYDSSRPVIEFYRSHTELVIRVPVR